MWQRMLYDTVSAVWAGVGWRRSVPLMLKRDHTKAVSAGIDLEGSRTSGREWAYNRRLASPLTLARADKIVAPPEPFRCASERTERVARSRHSIAFGARRGRRFGQPIFVGGLETDRRVDLAAASFSTSSSASLPPGLSKPSVNQAVHRREEIASYRVFAYALHTSNLSMVGATGPDDQPASVAATL